MFVNDPTEVVPGRTQRLIAFLLQTIGQNTGTNGFGGLPPGTVLLRDARLILATTCCPAPMYRTEISKAAEREGVDAILMRHDPNSKLPTEGTFDVFTRLGCHAFILPELVLYEDTKGYSLLSRWEGYHVVLAPGGILLRPGAPYACSADRCAGISAAADKVRRAVRPEAF